MIEIINLIPIELILIAGFLIGVILAAIDPAYK